MRAAKLFISSPAFGPRGLTTGGTMTSFLDIEAHAPDALGAPSSSKPSSASPDRQINTSIPIPLWEKVYRGITSPLRLLPDFLIIGTQRGGTTSLYHYLQAHPCIGPASTKEVHFFDMRFHKGLAWYRGHFPSRIDQYAVEQAHGHSLVTGEATALYLFHPHAPKRVAEALPSVKLIVLLRNPVNRALSHYYHAVKHGQETLSFEEAIQGEEQRTAQEREKLLAD